MNYEIIATLGPASQDKIAWQAMLSAGASAFRLNTSHLSLDQLQVWLERIATFYATLASPPALVLDLQGSKWRLGQFAPFDLQAGQVVELVLSGHSDRPGTLPVPHADFFRAAPLSSGDIVLNDAKIHLRMEAAKSNTVQARVTQGGPIAPNKGITFTASNYRTEALSEKDRAILERTRDYAFVRYAISYLKDAAEMEHYRSLFHTLSGRKTYLIAKLERGPAVEQALQIAASANEIWLCRGDLGAELGLPEMAAAVHRFSTRARELPVPVIMAGQVLEHMTGQPAPTRSEVCYLYDTLADGYQGLVLSDETAIGRYPIESCRAAAMFR